MPAEFDTDRWYWDRRNRKALYPRRTDDGTVEFVTVWHAEEVTDALAGGALVPIEEVGLPRTDTTFDLIDSFRTTGVEGAPEPRGPGSENEGVGESENDGESENEDGEEA